MEEKSRLKTQAHIRNEVIRLIKNKLEPQNSKYFILRSSKNSPCNQSPKPQSCLGLNSCNFSPPHKNRISRKKTYGFPQSNEQIQKFMYERIQKKVQDHVALQRISLLQARFIKSE